MKNENENENKEINYFATNVHNWFESISDELFDIVVEKMKIIDFQNKKD